MADPNLASIRDGPLDDSLTNLTWLQSLNVMTLGAPTPPITPDPPQDTAKAGLKVNPNQVLGTSYLPSAAVDGYCSQYSMKMIPGIPSLEKIDYKTNHFVKPPYSYATLICMAMAESKKSKITLAAIYNWITENFMYYRMADPSWQNSIRHNLSLNKCFEKVPRRKDEPGKGGFWRINPQYSDLLENGMFKKRRGSTRDTQLQFGRKSKKDTADDSERSVGKKKRKVDHIIDDDANTLSLGDDVTFNALLRQDIEINGVHMKTEDLIDDQDSEIAGSLIALSPSTSDESSENFDDLLRASDLNPADVDHAGAAGYGLGLMVHGVRIEPPEWWAESLTSSAFRGALHGSQIAGGLHTPPASSSPAHGHHPSADAHPWSTNRSELDEAIAALFGVPD